MAICNDRTLTYLNDQGYNVVKLPREGIAPLDVLGMSGSSMERLGSLGQIWKSAESVPAPGPAAAATNIAGKSSSGIHLSIGVKFLERVLSAFGAASPSLETAYEKASKLVFTFAETEVVGIDPFLIGDFLAEGDLQSKNPLVRSYFEDEEKSAFVITEVLRSRAINVSTEDSSKKSVGVDVQAVQDTIGGAVKVSRNDASESQLTFEGPKPLTFGFKCFEVGYADGMWQMEGRQASEDLAFSGPRPAGDPGEPLVLGRGRVAFR